MEAFESETVSSDSVPSPCSVQLKTTKRVRKRKIRTTEEFSQSLNASKSEEIAEQPVPKKRRNISFLPKIDDVVQDVYQAEPKVRKSKQARTSLPKKIATLKLGRLKLEQKRTKIRRSILKKPKHSKTRFKSVANSESFKKMKICEPPDESLLVLSNAAEEFQTEPRMSVRKNKTGALNRTHKSRSEQSSSKENLEFVSKELYVKLIPLEKTTLLNKDQILQLLSKEARSIALPLHSVNLSNRTSSLRRKSYPGKENEYERNTPKVLKVLLPKLPATSVNVRHTRKLGQLAVDRKNIHMKKVTTIPDNCGSCNVVIEKLTPKKLQLLSVAEGFVINIPDSTETVTDYSETFHSDIQCTTRDRKSTTVDVCNVNNLKGTPVAKKISSLRKAKDWSSEGCTSEDLLAMYISKLNMGSTKKGGSNSKKIRSSSVSKLQSSKKPVGKHNEFKFGSFHPESSSSPLVPFEDSSSKLDSSDNVEDTESSNVSSEGGGCFVRRLTYDLGDEIGPPSHNSSETGIFLLEDSLRRSSGTENALEQQPDNTGKQKDQPTYDIGAGARISVHNSDKKGEGLSTKENRKSSTKQNLTYELNEDAKTACDSQSTKSAVNILIETGRNTSSNNTTFDVESSKSSYGTSANVAKEVPAVNHSTCLQSALPRNRKSFSEPRNLCPKKSLQKRVARSYSADGLSVPRGSTHSPATKAHFSLRNIKKQSFVLGPASPATEDEDDGGELKQRPTFSLEESINDIVVLQSMCGATSTPCKLYGTRKTKSLNVKYSNKKQYKVVPKMNITRKTKSLDSRKIVKKDVSEILQKNGDPSYDTLDSTVCLGTCNSEINDSTYEVEDSQLNKTDDMKISENSFSCSSAQLINSVSIISISDDNQDSVASLSSSSSTNLEPLSPEILNVHASKKVTFGGNATDGNSLTQLKTPKSMLKMNNSKSGSKNRRVTFSNMSSIIVINDSDASIGSPVPTVFPPDDSAESNDDTAQFGCLATAGRTPTHFKKSTNKFRGSSAGQFSLGSNVPTSDDSSLSSPASAKKISSNTRKKSLSESHKSFVVKKATPKRTKMPNFARLHQKLFDDMIDIKEHSARKAQRAKLLLSGRKQTHVSSSSKTISKQIDNPAKKVFSKKQLQYSKEAPPSITVPTKLSISKRAQAASCTTKGKNKTDGCTHYGFKVTCENSVSKEDQKISVANKVKPPSRVAETKRTEIKGVRSNRRFELLMKMRQAQKK